MSHLALSAVLLAASVGLVALLTGCTSPAPAPHVTSASPGSVGHSPELQHVVIIVEENKPASAIIGNAAAPYLNGLASEFSVATNYRGVSHPSLPNYLALTSGTTAGITSDCNPPGVFCRASVANIADEIVASGRTWKAYAESMPAPCSPHNSGEYAVKHNPFLYYPSVTRDPANCVAHDVPYSQFARDLASTSTLPSYSFISPNLCNDMHDCSVAAGDGWLAREVPRILNSPAFTEQNSLLIITFDEAETSGNSVLCVFAGPAAKLGYTSSTPFSHYSILRTLEVAWGLDPLTRHDAAATPMTDMLATSP
ncbi:MAG: alkaline phosphatase family protein [Pseudolysinimonas sp.]